MTVCGHTSNVVWSLASVQARGCFCNASALGFYLPAHGFGHGHTKGPHRAIISSQYQRLVCPLTKSLMDCPQSPVLPLLTPFRWHESDVPQIYLSSARPFE